VFIALLDNVGLSTVTISVATTEVNIRSGLFREISDV